MSAVNIVPTAKGVSIFTDAAVYSPEGVLQDVADKCFVTANGKLAIGARGNHGFAKLIADVVSDRGWTFDDAAALVGALIDRFHAEADARMLERSSKAANDVFLVGWSDRHASVRTAFWTNLTEPRFQIGERASAWIVPGLAPAEIERATAEAREAGMDIGVFGIGLLKMQRMDKGDPRLGCGDRYTVGGHAMRTDVSADGISQRIIHRWPEDRIGAPIMPMPEIDPVAHPNVSIMPLNRAERRRLEKAQRRGAA